MKKLITLLLVLTGCVMSASADSHIIYVQNTKGYSDLWVHRFGGTGASQTWPGKMLKGGTTDYVDTELINAQTDWKEQYYTVDLTNYATFIINNNDTKQSDDLNVSDYPSGNYYYISESGTKIILNKVDVYEFTLNITTATTWSECNVHYWNATKGTSWPGEPVSDGTHTIKAYTSSINIIFNQGDKKPQTCEMTAVSGTNNYYICGMNKVDDVWGEAVKTNASGYATYVSTKALTIPASTAYVATDNNNGSATAAAVTNPAGSTAMLIKGNSSTTYHFGTAESGTSYASNAFHAGSGTGLASETDGKYNYILNGNTLKAANGQTVGTKKAYLQLSQQAPAGARVLKFEDEDETTGINTVENGQPATENTAVYNLNGQRIMKPTKGLYIQNGKKYIVK